MKQYISIREIEIEEKYGFISRYEADQAIIRYFEELEKKHGFATLQEV